MFLELALFFFSIPNMLLWSLLIQLHYCGSSLKAMFIMSLSSIKTLVVYHCSDKLIFLNTISLLLIPALRIESQFLSIAFKRAYTPWSFIFPSITPMSCFPVTWDNSAFWTFHASVFALLAASFPFLSGKILLLQGPAQMAPSEIPPHLHLLSGTDDPPLPHLYC